MNKEPILQSSSFEDLKKNINTKFLSDERERHNREISNLMNESREIQREINYDQYSRLNILAVIFAAIVIFSDKKEISLWLLGSISLMIIALIFGFWSKKLSLNASLWWNNKKYVDSTVGSWKRRKEYGDEFVDVEKDIFADYIDELSKKTNHDPLLEFLHLNGDKIEHIFDFAFYGSLFLLIFELLSKIRL